jgi:hypothetical protein
VIFNADEFHKEFPSTKSIDVNIRTADDEYIRVIYPTTRGCKCSRIHGHGHGHDVTINAPEATWTDADMDALNISEPYRTNT